MVDTPLFTYRLSRRHAKMSTNERTNHMIRVKNLENTADRKPADGSATFKEFYERRRGWPNLCSCISCRQKAEVGAHVKKVDSYDNKWYIVPLCRNHNNQFGEEIDVVENSLEPLY